MPKNAIKALTSSGSGSRLTIGHMTVDLPTGTKHGELGFLRESSSALAVALKTADTDKVDSAVRQLWKLSPWSELVRGEYHPNSASFHWWSVTLLRQPTRQEATIIQDLAAVLYLTATTESITACAAECFAVTNSRKEDHGNLPIRLSIMSQELQKFPADVVASAFGFWRRNEDWWPSLAEILRYCEPRSRWRRSLKDLADSLG